MESINRDVDQREVSRYRRPLYLTLFTLVVIIIVASNFYVVVDKANGAAVKSNLSEMRSQIEISFVDSPSYADVCKIPRLQVMFDTAMVAGDGSGKCYSGNSFWITWVGLKNTNEAWCVDSRGFSKFIPKPDAPIAGCF